MAPVFYKTPPHKRIVPICRARSLGLERIPRAAQAIVSTRHAACALDCKTQPSLAHFSNIAHCDLLWTEVSCQASRITIAIFDVLTEAVTDHRRDGQQRRHQQSWERLLTVHHHGGEARLVAVAKTEGLQRGPSRSATRPSGRTGKR